MEEAPKKKRGRPPKKPGDPVKHRPNPYSPCIGENGWLVQGDEKRAVVSRLVTETLRTYSMPKVKSNQELAQRIGDYFQHCAETGEKPTVEQMAQCTGYTSATVWDWENGRNKGFKDRLDDGSGTSEIIKRGKDFLRAFDAKLVVEGHINPVAYIFRAKNYYGMKDQVEVVGTAQNNLAEEPDAEKLISKYAGTLPDPVPVECKEVEE